MNRQSNVSDDVLTYCERLIARHAVAGLSAPALGQLLLRARLQRLGPGDRLFQEDSPVDGLHFIVHGDIELDRPDPEGARRAVGRRCGPDLYGDLMVVEGGVHACGAVATTRCLIATLPPSIAAPALLQGDALGAGLRRLLCMSMSAGLVEVNGALGQHTPRPLGRRAGQDHGHLRAFGAS